MCVAIVVLLVLLAVLASLHPGPEFVPHDCTRCQPDAAVIVSAAQLCRLIIYCWRSLTASTYLDHDARSTSAVLVALLLLLGGGVECNPGRAICAIIVVDGSVVSSS